ncbi:pectinesterase family protein [Adhaeribacter radiodurans]|uniref:Pectinesterase n=1 Tax=Adhaeribacter radiodurans TaxID=2745197 RepID=A0A7L7L3F2_9BACT|nr:pectinesterase family protein [Adhaeribacter radiodurans]QMU27095.1 pectin esterase [Adhaeribacter radiodurans]
MKYLLLLGLNLLMAITSVAKQKYDFVVAQNGSGNFKTVQEAINAVPDFRKKITTIFIKNGTYREKLTLPTSKTLVTFIGEDVKKTILTFDDSAQKKNQFGEELGTTGSASFYIFANDFTAENITFANSAGPVGQAVAVRIDGDRVFFQNCRFLGNQDTLYTYGENSRQYYKNCYIEGTVDFIFGWSTAFFEDCQIFCKQTGFVTAAATMEGAKFGYVFKNCTITGSAIENSFYLGRPWRPHAQTVFIQCQLGKQINPEGWHNWDKPKAEKLAFYAEYQNTGPGANPETRVKWSKQLTDEEAKEYTREKVLGDWTPGTLYTAPPR